MKIFLLRRIDRYAGITLMSLLKVFYKKNNLPKDPKKILVIKLFGIGNFIFLSPTLKNLKKIFPGAQIDILTLDQNRDICSLYKEYIDDIHTLRFSARYIIFDSLRFIFKNHKKYDIVIDFEQFVRLSALLGRMIKPKYLIGSATKNSHKENILDANIVYKEDKHVVEEYFDVVKYLAQGYDKKKLIDTDINIEPPLVQDSSRIKNIARSMRGHLCIGICIGGREENKDKRYPHFSKVISKILDYENNDKNKNNIMIIFFGSKKESLNVMKILEQMPDPEKKRCMNLAGSLSLSESCSLMSRLDLFVSNDTGPIHIAAAYGVYCIGIYGPTPEKIYRPYTKDALILRDAHKPIIFSYSEKENRWNPLWWPKPDIVSKEIIRFIKKSVK